MKVKLLFEDYITKKDIKDETGIDFDKEVKDKLTSMVKKQGGGTSMIKIKNVEFLYHSQPFKGKPRFTVGMPYQGMFQTLNIQE